MTHLYASDPNRARRNGDTRPPCAYCEATARGCDTNRWLRGRACCEACDGGHDGGADAQA